MSKTEESSVYTCLVMIHPNEFNPVPILKNFLSDGGSFKYSYRTNTLCPDRELVLKAGDFVDVQLQIKPGALITDSTKPFYVKSAYLGALWGTFLQNPADQEDTSFWSSGIILQSELDLYFEARARKEGGDTVQTHPRGTCLPLCDDVHFTKQPGVTIPVDSQAPISVAIMKIKDGIQSDLTVQMHLTGNLILTCWDNGITCQRWLPFNHDPRMKISPGGQ